MKKYLYLYIVLLFTGLLLSCKDESDSPTDPGDEIINEISASSFYPGNEGSSYTYEGEIESDSTSVSTGRTATIGTGKTIDGTVYLKQTNETTISGVKTTGTLFYRKDDEGVYFYVESDALLELLDSLGIAESDVELSADAEITLISYPFTDEWSAFSIKIASYKGLPLNVALMELSASYKGEEDITVEAEGKSMSAKKIVYTAKIGLPDAYEAYLPDVPSIEVEATAWFVEDIGLVRTEGSSFIIGTISGGDIAVSDSSSTMTENLVGYNIVTE